MTLIFSSNYALLIPIFLVIKVIKNVSDFFDANGISRQKGLIISIVLNIYAS